MEAMRQIAAQRHGDHVRCDGVPGLREQLTSLSDQRVPFVQAPLPALPRRIGEVGQGNHILRRQNVPRLEAGKATTG